MHIYEKDGKEYPSVTTILHSLGNDEIIKWANHLGFKHLDYEKELEKTSIIGTKVHDLLRGEIDPSYKPEITYKDELERITLLGYVTRFRNFIQDYNYETIFNAYQQIEQNVETMSQCCRDTFLERFYYRSQIKRFKEIIEAL